MSKSDNFRGKGLDNIDYLLAGSVSGFIARSCVQPLDVLKIRFQLQVEPIAQSSKASKYRGLVQAIYCIFNEEGSKAFWKGHVPAQLQAVSFTATQFLTFEVLSSWTISAKHLLYENDTPKLDDLQYLGSPGHFFCGCLAGSFAAAITQPLDVMRTRFIAQGEPKIYKGLYHAAFSIARREGIPGFFRGLSPSLLLIAPQTGLQFAIYNGVNRVLRSFACLWDPNIKPVTYDESESHDIGVVQSLIAGSLAGIGSKCVVYPLDVAKKRMQVQGFEEARIKFGRTHSTNGLRHCLCSVYCEEGAEGLFKGLKASLLKACVSIGCRFMVYEQICLLIRKRKDNEISRL